MHGRALEAEEKAAVKHGGPLPLSGLRCLLWGEPLPSQRSPLVVTTGFLRVRGRIRTCCEVVEASSVLQNTVSISECHGQQASGPIYGIFVGKEKCGPRYL